MGLFDLLSLGSRSLLAAQLAQATAGSNAANVNTPGYSRRRTSLVEAVPIELGRLRLGMGVRVTSIDRLRDRMLDAQWRLDAENLNYARAQVNILGQVGALLSPADESAIAQSLAGLWAAFGDLSTRPEDGTVRRALLSQADSLVNALRLTRDKLENLQRDAHGSIVDRVAEINGAAARLAALNVQIKQRPGDPSILDERDRLVDRLAELIGVRATVREDGSAQVVVNGTGIQLVDGARATTLAVSGDPVAGAVGLAIDGTALTAPGGELGGLLRMRNSATDGVPHAVARLDELAQGVITAVNRVHASGAGLALAQSYTGSTVVGDSTAPLQAAGLVPPPTAGTLALGVFDAAGVLVSTSTVTVDPATMSLDALAAALDALPDVSASVSGGQLVVSATSPAHRLAWGQDGSDALVALGVNGFFTGSDARTIAVNPALTADPRLIAAAQADLVAGRVSPGDGRIARALADLGEQRLLGGGSQTLAEFLGAIGGAVGAAGRAAEARAATLETVLQAVDAQRQSVAGVNLDEELADMVRYQHAYEASARYVRTISEMTQSLIDMI